MNQKLSVSTLAMTALLTACGGGDEARMPSLSLTPPTEARGSLSEGKAGEVVGPDAQNDMKGWEMPDLWDADAGNEAASRSIVRRGMRSGGLGLGIEGMDQKCFSLESGSDKDSDGDGIGEKRTRNISCSNEWITLKGRVSEWDDDDSEVLSGFRFLADYLNVDFKFGEQTVKMDLAGSMSLKLDSGKYLASGRLVADMNVPGQGSASMGQFSDFTVTPTDAANPGHGGTADLDGFMVAKVPARNIDVTLKMSGRGLVYDHATCGDGDDYKSGQVTLTDGDGNVITIDYADCTPTYRYNGKDMEPMSTPAPAPTPGRGRKA